MIEFEPKGENYGESVYSGEMSAYEWYQAEIEVDNECPPFERIPVTGYFKAKIGEEELEFNYYNTTVFVHDNHPMFDYIVHEREGNLPPYILYRPNDVPEDEDSFFDQLSMRCASIGCDFVELGSPRVANMERYYQYIRGNQEIEEVIEELLGSDDTLE